MSVEITIIGGGMAAVAAAVEGLAHGARVTVIRAHPGASALSAGNWDIAGDPSRFAGQFWNESRPASENLPELMRREPGHPYSILRQNPLVEDPGQFLTRAVERTSGALGVKLKGSLASPFLCLTPLGTARPTTFVPRGLEGGNLAAMKEASLLVVGVRGLVSFSAPMVAAFLKKLIAQQTRPHIGQVEAVEISLSRLPMPTSQIPLALGLDSDAPIEEFLNMLGRQLAGKRPTHIFFPPILGVDRRDHLLSVLHEATGLPCVETLALPPSAPGLRLQKAIDRFLGRGGIQLVEGEAVGAEKNGRTLTALKVRRKEGKEERLPVSRVILATGRYTGGGAIGEETFRETVLGLPLFAGAASPSGPLGRIFVGKLEAPRFLEDHPLFSVGLKVGHTLQPADERGRVIYENLWSAGGIIRGTNPAIDQTGMGVAVGTGILTGRLASQ